MTTLGELFGPYQLLAELGHGAMGEVFKAYDTRRQRVVALKRITAQPADDPLHAVERFKREARTTAALSSPHVIPIHDFGEIDGRLFIDMRLVHGADLAKVLHEEGPLAAERALSITAQLAEALDCAHAAGLVHRDLKPANTLVIRGRDDDFVYLADFGIVHVLSGAATRLTGVGTVLGTPLYMSPEVLEGRAPLDGRADVYALGCVLHEMLTGYSPYPLHTWGLGRLAQLRMPPPKLSAIVAGVPRALDDVLERALAYDRDQRYPTAGELAVAARRALTPPPPPAGAARNELAGPVRPPDPTQYIQPRPIQRIEPTDHDNVSHDNVSHDDRSRHDRGRERLAIGAVVLGVLLPVLGIVCGVLALRRLPERPAGRRARMLAWSAITIGTVLSLTIAAVGIWLAVRPLSVPTPTLEAQVAAQAGLARDMVHCPERLPAQLGAGVSCTLGAPPRQQSVEVTVIRLNSDGSLALDIHEP